MQRNDRVLSTMTQNYEQRVGGVNTDVRVADNSNTS